MPKKRIGELSASIRAIKTELLYQQFLAQCIANTLRALAEAFDPRCKDLKIVHVNYNCFTTTHDSKLSAAYRTIQNKRHPVFFLPHDATKVAQRILTLGLKLDELP